MWPIAGNQAGIDGRLIDYHQFDLKAAYGRLFLLGDLHVRCRMLARNGHDAMSDLSPV